jgi:sortase A
VQVVALVSGLLAAAMFSIEVFDGLLAQHLARGRFAGLSDAVVAPPGDWAMEFGESSGSSVSTFTDWSAKRISSYFQALTGHYPPPLARLRAPSVGLDVMVLDGTDDATLNRGAGHIAGTAEPGKDGNVGIAAHRDGWFRSLSRISIGDTLELDSAGGERNYRVKSIRIVEPEDVTVLAPSARSQLTLVTCYPFYFAGAAPYRFIVTADLAEQVPGTN